MFCTYYWLFDLFLDVHQYFGIALNIILWSWYYWFCCCCCFLLWLMFLFILPCSSSCPSCCCCLQLRESSQILSPLSIHHHICHILNYFAGKYTDPIQRTTLLSNTVAFIFWSLFSFSNSVIIHCFWSTQRLVLVLLCNASSVILQITHQSQVECICY